MQETLTISILFFLGFIAGGFLFHASTQTIIERFKDPQCIERTIGLETIKKCYVVQEVKE